MMLGRSSRFRALSRGNPSSRALWPHCPSPAGVECLVEGHAPLVAGFGCPADEATFLGFFLPGLAQERALCLGVHPSLVQEVVAPCIKEGEHAKAGEHSLGFPPGKPCQLGIHGRG